jgi:hypothetical protein
MKTQEDFLDLEIEDFEAEECQEEFNQLSTERKNDILFKRLLFDYDEDLPDLLKKFIKSNGKDPSWDNLILAFPEIKYVYAENAEPINIAKIVLKEITLY